MLLINRKGGVKKYLPLAPLKSLCRLQIQKRKRMGCAVVFNLTFKSIFSGHGQSSKALPFERLIVTPVLSCPHNLSRSRKQ